MSNQKKKFFRKSWMLVLVLTFLVVFVACSSNPAAEDEDTKSAISEDVQKEEKEENQQNDSVLKTEEEKQNEIVENPDTEEEEEQSAEESTAGEEDAVSDSGATDNETSDSSTITPVEPEEEQHIHSYSVGWNADESSHWKVCACGHKSDEAQHSFAWKIDQAAAPLSHGLKHEECACGYKGKEETIISPRKTVVDYMYAMANVVWTPSQDIDYSGPDAANSSSLIYKTGMIYLGMPYNNAKRSLEEFMGALNSGNVYASCDIGWNTAPGNSCSTSIEWAWKQVSSTVEYNYTIDMLPTAGTGVVAVGDVDWSTYDGWNTLTSVCYVEDLRVIYEAYAATLPGDAMVRYINTGGHALMVTKETVVAYDSYGNINPDASYVYLTDQNNRLHTRRGYSSSWELDRQVSFRQMLNEGYLPVTVAELRDWTW